VFLAAEGESSGDTRSLALELSDHIARLSMLVSKLLALPGATASLK
jgi:hypothetical protein